MLLRARNGQVNEMFDSNQCGYGKNSFSGFSNVQEINLISTIHNTIMVLSTNYVCVKFTNSIRIISKPTFCSNCLFKMIKNLNNTN